MAAINIYARFSDTAPVDGLCPVCWNPALVTYHLERVDLNGITIVGTRVACADCRKWVTPLEKLETAK